MWFEIKNTGADDWRDLGDSATKSGEAVRLGAPGDLPDPITGATRVSVADNANDLVQAGGPDCNDQPGCNRTVFTKAGLAGKAPADPGVYTSTWQLVDEGRGWFGPTMSMSFNVVTCPEVPGTGGPGGVGNGHGGADPGGAGGSSAAGRGGAPQATSGDASGGEAVEGGSCAVGGAPRRSGSSGWIAGLAFALLAGARSRRRTPARD